MLDALIDLPFVVSPVIVGLALILVYGVDGWFGKFFTDHGVRIIYAVPGLVLATIFVSLPFVVREVAPVLIEVGDEQEQAAATLGASGWQTFWRVTLPSIRWGVAYGVVLTTARALGEIGAVLVVSSNVAGSTLTLPLLVYQRSSDIGNQAITSAYAAATELAVMSLIVLLGMTLLGPGPAVTELRSVALDARRGCFVLGCSRSAAAPRILRPCPARSSSPTSPHLISLRTPRRQEAK